MAIYNPTVSVLVASSIVIADKEGKVSNPNYKLTS